MTAEAVADPPKRLLDLSPLSIHYVPSTCLARLQLGSTQLPSKFATSKPRPRITRSQHAGGHDPPRTPIQGALRRGKNSFLFLSLFCNITPAVHIKHIVLITSVVYAAFCLHAGRYGVSSRSMAQAITNSRRITATIAIFLRPRLP